MLTESVYVLPLDAVRQADAPRVGGKAAMLGMLLDAGFPIPAGLCITTAAFHHALAPFQTPIDATIYSANLLDPADAQRAAGQIALILAQLEIPAAIRHELQPALSTLTATQSPNRSPRLAIRSSATAEDRADASYAGQYETVLGVPGETGIYAAILDCWRS